MNSNKHYTKSIGLALLIAIIALGLLLRINFVFGPQLSLSPDAINYDAMVKQFLSKGFLGYLSSEPNAYVMPVYPLFLSIIYSIFGFTPESPLFMVRIIQALIGTASILLVYLIGKEILNNRVGLISAILFAIYPPFSESVTLILTEVLYTFFFLLYLLIQLKALKSPSPVLNTLSGVLMALAILIRPTLLPLFALPYIYQYIVTRDKKVFRSFGYLVLGITITMLPWWIRNYLTLGKFILLSTGSGNPLFAGAFPNLDFSNMKYVPPSEQFNEGIRLIINGFLTQPLTYIKWYTLGKFWVIFNRPWYQSQALQSIIYLHHVIVVLGFTGTVLAMISKQVRLIALFVILLTGLQLIFIPNPRYAYSIIPLLIVLAAHVIDRLFFRNDERTKEPPLTEGSH